MTSVSWRSRSELEAEKERLGDWVEAHKSMVLSHDLERYRPFLEDTKFGCPLYYLSNCVSQARTISPKWAHTSPVISDCPFTKIGQ